MNPEDISNPEQAIVPRHKVIAVKVIGIGTAGISVLERVANEQWPGVETVAINTESEAMTGISAGEKIHVENRLLRGLGSGGDPDRARLAAEDAEGRLKETCKGAAVVFIVAGLGGGTGTGIAPVLARIAKDCGALVLGFVTTPFECEGRRRQALALEGLELLKAAADGVICLPNQKVFGLINATTSVLDTFKLTGELLADGIRGIWRLLVQKGMIEIHFDDLCAVIRDRHSESVFAVAEAFGPDRVREVIDKLLAHPMLDGGEMLADSQAILVSLTGGPDLAMSEVHLLMKEVQSRCEKAQVIMGAAIEEKFRERLAVTLIAARREQQAPSAVTSNDGATNGDADSTSLTRGEAKRPQSRFVAPAPSLSAEKMEQLLKRQTGSSARGRKASARMRQAQLPLEIVSKGRFDKSEPTIHKGEDLDVPTYIRRGISLN